LALRRHSKTDAADLEPHLNTSVKSIQLKLLLLLRVLERARPATSVTHFHVYFLLGAV